MDEQQIRQIIQEVLTSSQYGVPTVPYHIHNNIDAPFISSENVISSAHGTVYLSTNQANTGALVKVAFNTELFATSGVTWDSTNNRFSITATGVYFVTGSIYFAAPAANKAWTVDIKKNGDIKGIYQIQSSGTPDLSVVISRIMSLQIGDYIELWAGHSDTGNSHDIVGTENYSFMSIAKV